MQAVVRIAFIFFLGLFGWSYSVFDVEFDGPIEDHAQFIADTMNRKAPFTVDGYTLTGVRSEGRVLIVEGEMEIDGNIRTDEATMSRLLRPFVCDDAARKFIARGGVQRLDVEDPNTGFSLPPAKVAYCG